MMMPGHSSSSVSAWTRLSILLGVTSRPKSKVVSDSKATSKPNQTADESSQRRHEFHRHLQAAKALIDSSTFCFTATLRAGDQCIFVEGVASPSDYMALVFRRRCRFLEGEIYVENRRFDAWLPFDLWSLVADFVAPRLPLEGVSVADKIGIHSRMSSFFNSAIFFKDSDGGGIGAQFKYEERLHHMSSLIELDASSRRSERADLHLGHGNYKAALVDYNYDLFHRDTPLAPKETEGLYRNRSDALYGMNDIGGAVDSRTMAIRLSAEIRLVESDMATIDKWLEELRMALKSGTGDAAALCRRDFATCFSRR
jgi:hypothetical protein